MITFYIFFIQGSEKRSKICNAPEEIHFESDTTPNPKKFTTIQEMIGDIVEEVVGQVGQKRWLCPICGCFDSVCGTSNKNEVWKHILRHAKYLMDVRIKPTKTSKRLICLECSCDFDDSDSFILHMAFSHNM